MILALESSCDETAVALFDPALGMTTVVVVPEGQRDVFREAWELEGRDAPFVDHLTDDLSTFLEEIVRR